MSKAERKRRAAIARARRARGAASNKKTKGGNNTLVALAIVAAIVFGALILRNAPDTTPLAAAVDRQTAAIEKLAAAKPTTVDTAAIKAATPAPATQQGGAPAVGSKLPKDMVPGEWYATGTSKTFRAGTVVDTTPKDCVRDGVAGECALRKRGRPGS